MVLEVDSEKIPTSLYKGRLEYLCVYGWFDTSKYGRYKVLILFSAHLATGRFAVKSFKNVLSFAWRNGVSFPSNISKSNLFPVIEWRTGTCTCVCIFACGCANAP